LIVPGADHCSNTEVRGSFSLKGNNRWPHQTRSSPDDDNFPRIIYQNVGPTKLSVMFFEPFYRALPSLFTSGANLMIYSCTSLIEKSALGQYRFAVNFLRLNNQILLHRIGEPLWTRGFNRRKRQSCRFKIEKPAEGDTMISRDGYTEMPPKAKSGRERACASKRKGVRLPGRSVWKRIQRRLGLNDLAKAERDALVHSLRLAATEE
jgi:hypothetical protein